jgi:hypothetical protein
VFEVAVGERSGGPGGDKKYRYPKGFRIAVRSILPLSELLGKHPTGEGLLSSQLVSGLSRQLETISTRD